jgi:type II secretory pathway pseudopilin PulG
MDAWQVVVIALGVIGSLLGIIYWAGQSRDDKQDKRFETNENSFREHVREDVRAHERLTAVETEVANLKTEVRGLREMRHDIMTHVSQSLASWYSKIVEMIGKDK